MNCCDLYKSIKKYEGFYTIDIWGNIFCIKRNEYLNFNRNKNYTRVHLSKNGIRKSFFVHRLIAETFLDNFENKPMVNHKDSNPKNFSISNLEWVTEKENSQHAIKNNRIKYKRGEKHKSAVLSNLQVLEVFYAEGSYQKIANHFNVSKRLVGFIKNKKTRKFLFENLQNTEYDIKKLKINELKDNRKPKITDIELPHEKRIIKTDPNYTIDIYGNVRNIITQKYLTPCITPQGYLSIKLPSRAYPIHRLVAMMFIHNYDIKNKILVNHKDGNKINNAVDNLEWVTPSENTQYYYDLQNGKK